MVQALEGVQSMADEAGVRLAIVPATGALWGDSDRIIQTLTNLLGNAIKFSPPDTTVTLSGVPRARGLHVLRRRSGTRRARSRSSRRSSSASARWMRSDSRDKGGSGLGLAICQSIVNAHGGRIWAEKNDPAGSRFQFTIPLGVPAGHRRGRPRSSLPDQDQSRAPSILVVEDDLDLAQSHDHGPSGHGFRTFHAVTGSEAIRICTAASSRV